MPRHGGTGHVERIPKAQHRTVYTVGVRREVWYITTIYGRASVYNWKEAAVGATQVVSLFGFCCETAIVCLLHGVSRKVS